MLTTQAVLIITVVNTMLLRAAVLKTCCLSTKFHIVLHSLFVFWVTAINYFARFSLFRGCSYENSFPVVFSLSREKNIISPRSYTKYFLAWTRFILASCYVGNFWEKPIFKMGDINLKKSDSVLLFRKYQGLILFYVRWEFNVY